jgi:hypothetical protein
MALFCNRVAIIDPHDNSFRTKVYLTSAKKQESPGTSVPGPFAISRSDYHSIKATVTPLWKICWKQAWSELMRVV